DQEVSLTLKEDGGILCIARDMRDRRREMAERDRLREELQLAQRREVVGQMAAGLAHDFNNLLATISGGARLIQEESSAGSPGEVSAKRIQSAATQAAGLVKRLLSLGRREVEPVVLDLREPLREAGDLVRASLRAPARLNLHLPDNPIQIEADSTDVLQTVLNLAINARDALDGGPGAITITLEQPGEDDLQGPFMVGNPDLGRGFCAIKIADTGPGMSSEQVARAFRPYETTKGTDGSGLGLTIVSSVINRVGGALKLETAPGQGSMFTILWPEAPTPIEQGAVIEGLSGRLDRRTVMVVDDHEEVLDIITMFLESAGAEVAPSSDPQDVIEALRDDPDGWDLLITDFDMPGMNGAELAQTSRALVPHLPVVLVTALAGMAGRDNGMFDAVLGKPLDKAALVNAAEIAILRANGRED
ncbi:MAG: hybrid sensor histidine kinase/response regulator, partial [Roseovarius sp.]